MNNINFDFNTLTEKEKINYIIHKKNYNLVLNEFGQHTKIINELKTIAPTVNEFYLATKLYEYMPNNMFYNDKLELIKMNQIASRFNSYREPLSAHECAVL